MKHIALFCLLACTPLLGAACEPAPERLPFTMPGTRAAFEADGALVIVDGTRRVRIADVSERLDHVPDAPCVHSVQTRDAEYFVVVTVSRLTNGYPPTTSAGGAGVEAYAKWLHLVGDKVSESTAALFSSWRDNREGGFGWRESIFTVTTEDLQEGRASASDKAMWTPIAWAFDPRHPEQGLRERRGTPHQ
jgi:hypothetical protein